MFFKKIKAFFKNIKRFSGKLLSVYLARCERDSMVVETEDLSNLLSKINDNLELDIGVAMDDFEVFKKSASLYISGVVLEKMDKALASFDIENMRELIAETTLKLKAKEDATYE